MIIHDTRSQSLAATRSGDSVEIRRILFGALRDLCTDLGLFEGQWVRCRAGTASQLLLETGDGRTVALQRDWARFIQVGYAAENQSEASPTA